MSKAGTPTAEHDAKDLSKSKQSTSLISQAIADVLPSSDPFDNPDFDVTAIINSYFPTELSLSTVETTAEKLEERMTQLDGEILDAVEAQSSTGTAVKKDLEQANQAVLTLTEKLEGIRTKSEETESMVREICSDIQTLDNAKRNLTSTITALRRLHMLETAVEQLSILTTERAYKEAANLLEAVTQLASNFDSYKAIPKICELLASVRALRSELQAQVFEEFKMHIDPSMSDDVSSMLADAALVVSVLGPGLILKLVQWFSDKELAEYSNLFDPAKQPATLEGVERRFAWLKRWLRSYQATYAHVLPASWKVPQLCAESFCDLTRQHLSVLLQRMAKENSANMDVRRLLFVIQQSIEMEKELTKRFFPSVLVRLALTVVDS